MKENLYYININNQLHFVHEHASEEIKESPYVFLNPTFDEKKRSQRFYAETAREFCKKGIPVVRFDYYGTGDSYGQLFEADFGIIQKNIIELINNIIKKYNSKKINLFGIRIGADLAIKIAENNPELIEKLILVEPVVNGKYYLIEQRSRRKIFYKINKMTDVQEKIVIDGKTYEDHQGYPISVKDLQFLDDLDSMKADLSKKCILLVKLDTISSRKTIAQLKQRLEEQNIIIYHHYACDDFWANLELINTTGLTESIIEKSYEI